MASSHEMETDPLQISSTSASDEAAAAVQAPDDQVQAIAANMSNQAQTRVQAIEQQAQAMVSEVSVEASRQLAVANETIASLKQQNEMLARQQQELYSQIATLQSIVAEVKAGAVNTSATSKGIGIGAGFAPAITPIAGSPGPPPPPEPEIFDIGDPEEGEEEQVDDDPIVEPRAAGNNDRGYDGGADAQPPDGNEEEDYEAATYKYKDLKDLKMPQLPKDSVGFRSWRNALLTQYSAIDRTGQARILRWLQVCIRTEVTNREIAQLQNNPDQLPRLDSFLASQISDSRYMKGEFGLEVQAYIERAHAHGVLPSGRAMIAMLSRRFRVDRVRGATVTQQTLLAVTLDGFSYNQMLTFKERVEYILNGIAPEHWPSDATLFSRTFGWLWEQFSDHLAELREDANERQDANAKTKLNATAVPAKDTAVPAAPGKPPKGAPKGCSVAITGPLPAALSIADHLQLLQEAAAFEEPDPLGPNPDQDLLLRFPCRALCPVFQSPLLGLNWKGEDRIRRAWRAAASWSLGGSSHLHCCCWPVMAAYFSLEELVPYHQSRQILVYEHPAADGEGVLESMAAAVLKRDMGFLLALPCGLLEDSEIAAGLVATIDSPLGPTTVVDIPAGSFSGETFVPAGRTCQVTLADLSVEALSRVGPFEHDQPPEVMLTFDPASPELVPEPQALLTAAQAWISDPSAAAYERATTAQQGGAIGNTGPSAAPPDKPKKPSMAGLSAQLDTLCATLPALTSKLAEVDQKQQEMANLIAAGGAGPLRQPLGGAASSLGASAKAPAPLAARLGPPPGTRLPAAEPLVSTLDEAQEAEEALDTGGSSDPLARAMLLQSQALTSLVQQLAAAGGDGSLEPSVAGALGVRGSAQRAKLQEELAQGKGAFFQQVTQNIARRMMPSQSLSSSPAELLTQGVSMSRYLERFGGWANSRDLGLLAYQVGLIFDALLADRTDLARDHVALLATCLEQAALDHGRMEVAYQLTLLEDPPSSMFLARSGPTARGRAFAPMASQRWVSVVLAHLRELDTIQARRAEHARPGRPPPQPTGDATKDEEDSPPPRRRPPKKK
ncbi:unnamed protein product [Symbiodinium sp. CCMP2592]|nr:unnamed protein product [Symbiodinium sp. CCMP2592]